jgi:hypothetical protein
MLPRFVEQLQKIGKEFNFKIPIWFGDKKFHDSHKSNLLRKNPIHYSKYKWNVPDNLPYVWFK